MNTSTHRTLLVLIGLTLIHSFAFAENAAEPLVIQLKKRHDLLEKGSASINKEFPNKLELISSQPDPFASAIAQTPVVAPANNPTTEVVPEKIHLNDDEALELMAKTLSPQGMMKRGDKKILNLGKGKTLLIGDPVKIKVRDATYTGEIMDMTTGTFTLKINSTIKTFPIGTVRSGANIKRTVPINTESTNP
ncbi:MAG: hypothetical protein SFY80_06170 [Verrucomicrobiota bacterium]|nr:hypothetical protein [Verrucomicrobiota bacterium]